MWLITENELQSKQKEIEAEAAALIARGGKVKLSFFLPIPCEFVLYPMYVYVAKIHFFILQVFAAVLPYEEACNLCGGCLPDYISKVRKFLKVC